MRNATAAAISSAVPARDPAEYDFPVAVESSPRKQLIGVIVAPRSRSWNSPHTQHDALSYFPSTFANEYLVG